MFDSRTAPYAALVLRLGLGVAFVAHGLVKLLVFTPAGTAGFFAKLGLPPELAYLVMAAELGGGIALILGLFTRWVSLLLVPVLVGAIVTVHWANGWSFAAQGGGWEYPAMWTLALVVQALLGDGAFALRIPLAQSRSTAREAA